MKGGIFMPKIKKAASGKYEFWVDLGRDPLTGKRRQVHRGGFATKREAENELRRLQNEADSSIVVKKQQANVTFEEFSKDWLEWYSSTSGNKPSTIESRRALLKIAYNYIGQTKLKDFNKVMYGRFLTSLNEDYKPNSLNSIHVTTSMVLDYAVECGLIPTNPAKSAKKPKTVKSLQDVAGDIEEKYLTRTEVERLMQAAKDYGNFQNFALLRLLIYSGLRIGEALALETSNVDFKHSMVKVRQTICTGTVRNTRSFRLQTPKTSTSIRDVELDSETMEILHQQIIEQKKKRLKAGPEWYNEHDFVFTSEKYSGYPIFYNSFTHTFYYILKALNLNKRITIHSLRHTHASLLAESGATLEQIQQRLGHSNDDITKRVYLHVTKDSKANMVTNFAAFMSAEK